ncbi:MAG: hypothetical protein ACLFO2_05215, partial [Candidatus Woesearchaeota archaeon]
MERERIDDIVRSAEADSRTPLVFSAKNFANTLGMFGENATYRPIRIHDAELYREPTSYLPHPRGDGFYSSLSSDPGLDRLVEGLLRTHDRIFAWSYNAGEFPESYGHHPGRIVDLGVSPSFAKRYESKLEQFPLLEEHGFSLAPFGTFPARQAMERMQEYDRGKGVYLTRATGSGGKGVCVTSDPEILRSFVEQHCSPDEEVLMQVGLDVADTLSLDVLVADDVLVPFAVTQSLFSQDKKQACVGSVYPVAPEYGVLAPLAVSAGLKEAAVYRDAGARGILNFDFPVVNTPDGPRLYLGEMNPRGGASWANVVAMYDAARPEGAPSIVELLIHSKMGGDLSDYLSDGRLWTLPDGYSSVRKRIS